ncbi:hypothetical protein C5167_030780 [Papaver somniferum]|nr:hypothetical protein C5167_030780 [Papaver somniferum]
MVFSSPLGLGLRQLAYRRYRQRRRRNKRLQAACNANPVVSNTISGVDGDSVDLVMMEILSRLRVKSLLRFKCVCKRWRYLIEQDPYFIDLHLTRSIARPNLFMVVPTETRKPIHRGGTSCKDVFLAANLISEGSDSSTAAVHTVIEIDSPCYSKILGPLNERWLPANPICKLGFDPATKEHKFICAWDICPTGNLPSYQVFEVLTVGDTTWRRNNKIPPFKLSHFEDPSSYTNGSTYYKTSVLYSKVHDDDDDRPEFIVAFDVGSEMFRAPRVPKFILYRPRDTSMRRTCLSEVDGRLALLTRVSGYIVKLGLLDDRSKEHKGTGTDRIIIISYRRARSDDKTYEDEVSVHSCNWKKTSTFRKIKITGIPSSIMYCFPFTIFTTFCESLLPVQKRISSNSQSYRID